MKKRVVAYCRVSTDFDGQIESFDHQIDLATEKILCNPEWEFAGIYADPAFSGTNAERPEFKRMMNDARRHKFDIILVKSMSRFARNTLLTIQTLEELKKLGISVQFEKEQIDTGAPYSEMLLTIMASFAQEESRNISERVKKGLRMRALNGEVNWANVYGFMKKNGEEYVIVPEEAEAVHRIYDEYEHGESMKNIALHLNEDGYPSPSGQEWKTASVSRILNNPKYAGDVLTNKFYTQDHLTHKLMLNKGEVERIRIEDHHKGIIEKDQYERVQEILNMHLKHQYPFAGKLVCPLCGRHLKKIWEKRINFWGCEDDKFFIRHDHVEDAVLRAYEQMDPGEDEKLRKLKETHPTMETAEFWWMNGVLDKVVFGKHYGLKDCTATVTWHNSTETTVETKAKRLWRNRNLLVKEQYQPERGEKRVRKISAKKDSES